MNQVNRRKTIESKIEAIVSDFASDPDWETRYKRVIDLGKKLPPLPEQFRSETFKVKGCQSQVWLHAETDFDGTLKIHGDSDAVIVRGLVALLVEVYSGSMPEEILKVKPDFISKIGFDTSLSPSRANGLNAMIRQIYLYATALSALKK